jgi:hypothetical protein
MGKKKGWLPKREASQGLYCVSITERSPQDMSYGT